MVEKLRFHARYQKCSLVSIEGLKVMTVNIEEGKYGGGEQMCLCQWRYKVLWHSCTGLRGLLDSR